MGLIRKSLMVGSVGLVRGSSKKQRVAKKSLNEAREQTRLMQQQIAAQAAQAAQAQAMQAQAVPPQPVSVPAGWYADPSGAPCLRWWDGQQWTTATAPQPRNT